MSRSATVHRTALQCQHFRTSSDGGSSPTGTSAFRCQNNNKVLLRPSDRSFGTGAAALLRCHEDFLSRSAVLFCRWQTISRFRLHSFRTVEWRAIIRPPTRSEIKTQSDDASISLTYSHFNPRHFLMIDILPFQCWSGWLSFRPLPFDTLSLHETRVL